MYFCPCSCSKPDGESEDDILICLPRNLSYTSESYLDRYSVSSTFVNNPKIEKQLMQADAEERYLLAGARACAEQLLIQQQEESEKNAMADDTIDDVVVSRPMMRRGIDYDMNADGTMSLLPSPSITMTASRLLSTLQVDTDDLVRSHECNDCNDKLEPSSQSVTLGSPDSDLMSEEGIFVNMQDDLDIFNEGPNGKSTASDASDDTRVSEDSQYFSPEETEGPEDEEVQVDVKVVSRKETFLHVKCESNKYYMPAESKQTSNISDHIIQINDRPVELEERRRSILDLVSPESPVYEDREFNFTRTELRKSASLKSSKTPPGTPRRKKVVRFADAMGLDLESVRHILNLESPPKIPASAMAHLHTGLALDRKEMGVKFLSACFDQPGGADNFLQRVLGNKVCLENAVAITGTTITGVVRVANISFHKSVRVRFTTNGWNTFHDIAASYVQNSHDGATDRFSFTIVTPADFVPGCKVEFALSYSTSGAEYWDNNNGMNYVFECFAKTVPTESENYWMHFL